MPQKLPAHMILKGAPPRHPWSGGLVPQVRGSCRTSLWLGEREGITQVSECGEAEAHLAELQLHVSMKKRHANCSLQFKTLVLSMPDSLQKQ